MAITLNFPAKYPPCQWRMRQRIAEVAAQLDFNPESILWGEDEAGRPKRWFDLSDEELNGVWDSIRSERLRDQYAAYLLSTTAKVTSAKEAQEVRRAKILQFPVSEEILANIQRRQSDREKQVVAAKASPKKSGRTAARKESNAALRKKLVAKVQIAKKDLMHALPEFTDQTYRFILEMKFNVSSSKALTAEQLHELLLHFQELGWQQKVKGKPSVKGMDHPLLYHDPTGLGRDRQMRKVQALLLEKSKEAGQAYSFTYALGILRRQTSGVVTCFEDASPVHLRGVIAALVQDAARKGRRAL